MAEALFYLATSFWLGALHAATPGHGKTIAASYIVGVRGRPIDAFVLGLFVTLSHTSGIVLVAVLATLGSTWLIPERVEAYLAVGTGCLVVGIGLWMLRSQWGLLSIARGEADGSTPLHRHAWGRHHTHDLETVTRARPSTRHPARARRRRRIAAGPGRAGHPARRGRERQAAPRALHRPRLQSGVRVVLVVVGLVAVRVGRMLLAWLTSRWVAGVQIGLALVIVGIGLVLTTNAARLVATLR